MDYKLKPKEAYKLLHYGSLALQRASMNGIRVDIDYINENSEYLTKEINEIETKLKKTKFWKEWRESIGDNEPNYNSNPQLKNFLYQVKGYKPFKYTDAGKKELKEKGESDKGSTDEEALKQLKVKELNYILRIRKLTKIRDVYLKNFKNETVRGYMHPFFNLHTARSFRSSSSAINFQNIPSRDKEAMEFTRRPIYPRPGNMLLEVDFASLEVGISACVTEDTEIETTKGVKSIKNIINSVNKNENIYIYGYDTNKNRIAISKVNDGGITRKKAKVWQLKLDNGEIIKATYDHKFLLRSGKYKKLSELEKGDSLMPLYKKKKKSKWSTVYRHVYLNNGKHEKEHNLIAEDVYGIKTNGNSEYVVHHIDGNGCNNSEENLQIISRKEHMQIHSIQGWNNKPLGVRNHWGSTEEGKKYMAYLGANQIWTKKKREELGKRISESIKRRGGHYNENNPMYNKKHSEESKLKISKSKKGQSSWNKGKTKYTDNRLKKQGMKVSESKKGKPGGNKGKKLPPLSKSTKKKLSNALKGRKFSNIQKEKLSNKMTSAWNRKKELGKKEICKVCGKAFFVITESHVRNKHNMSYQDYKKMYNHKVESITFYGYEDVYNIDVEGIHNYATKNGVIIKNCYHQDPTMLSYLREGGDMHADVACQIFFLDKINKESKDQDYLRKATKNSFTFPQFYGDYYKNNATSICQWTGLSYKRFRKGQGMKLDDDYLSDHLIENGIKNYNDLIEHIKEIERDFWENRFPVYKKWKDNIWEFYKENGYVDTYTGFRCGGVMMKNQVTNIQTQATAFHCLLWSFIKLDFLLKDFNTKLIGQIHDSIVFDMNPKEFDEVIQLIKKVTMKDLPNAWKFIIVPLSINAEVTSIDGSWADKKEIKI